MESSMIGGRAALKMSSTNRRQIAVGTPGSRPFLTPQFPPTEISNKEPMEEVQIQWKPVLENLVQVVGGTEPIFTPEDTGDEMFQLSVSFSLPVDRNRNAFENIVAIGNKCFTVWEAESEASAAGLQKLEGGRFGTQVTDISRLRCEEMKNKCQQLLVKAGELYGAVRLVLSDWQETMVRVETCYVKLSKRTVEGMLYGAADIFGEIMLNLSEELLKVHKASEPRYKEMMAGAKDAKSLFGNIKEQMNKQFYTPCIKMIGQRIGDFPQQLRLSMKIILNEIMKSIGWSEPHFNVIKTGPGVYVCEIFIFPNHEGMSDAVTRTKIRGPEAISEADAIDSGCKAVILSLENNFGICLVDINYNKRSHTETHVSEAEHVTQMATSIGDKILAEWELMVEDIDLCGRKCQDLAEKHPRKEPGDEMYHLKRECALIVDRLHKDCLFDLELAKRRFANAGTWINE